MQFHDLGQGFPTWGTRGAVRGDASFSSFSSHGEKQFVSRLVKRLLYFKFFGGDSEGKILGTPDLISYTYKNNLYSED